MDYIGARLFYVCIFSVLPSSYGFVLLHNTNETLNDSSTNALGNTSVESSSKNEDLLSLFKFIFTDDGCIEKSNNSHSIIPEQSYFSENGTLTNVVHDSRQALVSESTENLIPTEDLIHFNNTDSDAIVINQPVLSENSSLIKIGQDYGQEPIPDLSQGLIIISNDFLHLNSTDSDAMMINQSGLSENGSLIMNGKDYGQAPNPNLSEGLILSDNFLLFNTTDSNAKMTNKPDVSENSSLINFAQNYGHASTPEPSQGFILFDHFIQLNSTDFDGMMINLAEVPENNSLVNTGREYSQLPPHESPEVMILFDKSNLLITDSKSIERADIAENFTMTMVENSTAPEISRELILHQLNESTSKYIPLEQSHTFNNGTAMNTELYLGSLPASKLSTEMLLPDDPRLLNTTDSSFKSVELSDFKEPAVTDNILDFLSSSEINLSEEMILPDDPRIVSATTSTTFVFERSELSDSEKMTHVPSENVIIFYGSPINSTSITPNSSEYDKVIVSTTERVLEDKNIFDVPKKECEKGMRRDRRGKCRPVLYGTSRK